MAEMRLTERQSQAVYQRGGNLLVSAAAGSGKTSVLAKRIVSLVEEGDILWFKASRGMKLEEVLSRLYERF